MYRRRRIASRANLQSVKVRANNVDRASTSARFGDVCEETRLCRREEGR